MAYDQQLADRVRSVLSGRQGLNERSMFGGLAFMLGGNMLCGIVKDNLMVRVGPERYQEALTLPHARPMDFTGRPLKGFLYVGPDGYRSEEALSEWLRRAADFASSLPPK